MAIKVAALSHDTPNRTTASREIYELLWLLKAGRNSTEIDSLTQVDRQGKASRASKKTNATSRKTKFYTRKFNTRK